MVHETFEVGGHGAGISGDGVRKSLIHNSVRHPHGRAVMDQVHDRDDLQRVYKILNRLVDPAPVVQPGLGSALYQGTE